MTNMRDRLAKTSQFTVQKVRNLSDFTKLNGTMSNAEKEIRELYGEIRYEYLS